MPERVVLEVAPKKAFASALDLPGWSRSGRTEDDALAALLDYGPRYASVAGRAGIDFSAPAGRADLEIVERLPGNGTTEFGAPGKPAAAEDEPISPDDLERLLSLLAAAWATFDAAVARADGVELTTGPRGGGRDLAKITGHVRDAEAGYLGQLGSRPPTTLDDPALALEAIREAFVQALTARVTGAPLPNPRQTRKPWSPRYAVRRAAWHVLDHAWEVEDRSR